MQASDIPTNISFYCYHDSPYAAHASGLHGRDQQIRDSEDTEGGRSQALACASVRLSSALLIDCVSDAVLNVLGVGPSCLPASLRALLHAPACGSSSAAADDDSHDARKVSRCLFVPRRSPFRSMLATDSNLRRQSKGRRRARRGGVDEAVSKDESCELSSA